MTYFKEILPTELPKGYLRLYKFDTKEQAQKWAEDNQVVLYWLDSNKDAFVEKDDFNPS